MLLKIFTSKPAKYLYIFILGSIMGVSGLVGIEHGFIHDLAMLFGIHHGIHVPSVNVKK